MMIFILILITLLLSSFIFIRLKRNQKTIGICHACAQNFIEQNLREIDSYFLCNKDYQQYLNLDLIDFIHTKSDPNQPENSLYINRIKEKLCQNQIFCLISTDYEQVDNVIFSYFLLKVDKNSIKRINELLS